MYCNTTVGSLPLGLSRRLFAFCSSSLSASFASLSACRTALCLVAICALALAGPATMRAQVAGDGAITGTIVDKDGKVVPHATVTATNTETGVQVKRETTGAGDYSISPLQAGNYNIEVVAKGFNRLLQENIQVNSTQNVGLPPLKLTVGGGDTTITITDAPPFLETTNATLGGTIENELYTNLPLSMSGGPRDPTAFQYLMPGVQEGAQVSSSGGVQQGIYGGTGQANLNENYIEGVPVTNVQTGGDNSVVSKSVSADAVDQFSVQTNGSSTSFGGAGVTNYTIKSGGNQLHGEVFDYVRNTILDTWGYFAKVPLSNGFAKKPPEHQNSYGASLGGPIIKDKLFFFGIYEGFAYTKVSNTPQYITIPTCQERGFASDCKTALSGAGSAPQYYDFTDQYGSVPVTAGTGIYDPTAGSRTLFHATENGVPTYNVIPANEVSSFSTYLASALPTPTNLSTVQNYLAGLPLQNKDYKVNARIDYTISARNKFSLVGVGGNQGFGTQPDYTTLQQLPTPYASGYYTNSKTTTGVLSYTYVATQTLINSLKYSYTRNWGETFSITNGTPYTAAKAGILGLPPGNASNNAPEVNFSAGTSTITAPANWNGSGTQSSGPTATNTYVVIDQLQWIKGKHNLTFGLQIEWLQTNQGAFGGYSSILDLTANGNSTAGPAPTGQQFVGGSPWASYLVGAFYNASITEQTVSDLGGRFRPDALYIEDQWRYSPKVTLDLGIRYDYLQPFHEAEDRIAFLNPTKINPIVGIPGVQEYGGFPGQGYFKNIASINPVYENYICHCTTPVKPYNWNFGPHIGVTYAPNQGFVIRGNYTIALTRAGATGGGSTFKGTQNNPTFNSSTSWNSAGSTSVPGLFLNDKISSNVQGISTTTATTQPNYSTLPTVVAPGVNVNPLAGTGNYNFTIYDQQNGITPPSTNPYLCGSSDGQTCNPTNINYEDTYYGGRGPEFVNYNLGFQQMINKKAVLSVNYAGSQTHFLPGGAGRGPATNNISPDYYNELRSLLGGTIGGSLSTLQSIVPTFKVPYANFAGPGATVAKALTAYPQYGTFTDLWGDTGNSNYNSLQLSVIQRPWHNLSGFMNYTRSKSIDNTHGHRTQYGVGPQDGNFTRSYTANQVDRGLGSFNQTNAFNLTWVYAFPIGRGQAFFATNRLMSLIGGGWQISGIYQYRDGVPLQITNGAGCETNTSPLASGTCLPDYAPGFNPQAARINGRWGRGPGANASNINSVQYLNPAAFVCPDSPVTAPTQTCGTGSSIYSTYKLGNIAKSAPDNLYGPGWWALAGGIRRTFVIVERPTLHLTFQAEGDVINATNSTFFNVASTAWNNNCNPQSSSSNCNLAYGAIGGQNLQPQVAPRDWQLQGRFRF
jgi:hypothetical protein